LQLVLVVLVATEEQHVILFGTNIRICAVWWSEGSKVSWGKSLVTESALLEDEIIIIKMI
jgi:hypothetical protein